ncbi:MAG: 2-C-methyl-D-erythritol 4-phosphate cytidylyltransferase [Oscillospiraceae bacterium]|nr:2-C-methyl-D-erythritol 4-phosphate cytidylyltransferase [Oscillospiraceae bacterium]
MGISKLSQVIRNILPLKYCGAVIVAAGTASRMQGIDKVMAELGGEPMILRTVRAFENCDVIGQIVIVTREDLVEKIQALCAKYPKVTAVTIGGADRAESVRNGLKLLSPKVRLAAIHDGARPLVTDAVIDRTVRAAHRYGAAAPGVPVKDTVKVVRGGFVKSTPDRSTLQAVQTPQIFDVDLLTGALEKAKKDNAAITDDCSAVELMGMSVKIVAGDERNIKVTTPTDLKIAASLLEEM